MNSRGVFIDFLNSKFAYFSHAKSDRLPNVYVQDPNCSRKHPLLCEAEVRAPLEVVAEEAEVGQAETFLVIF